MKNVLKLFGIIALAAVIGFSMAACDNGDNGGGDGNDGSLNGTWTHEDMTLIVLGSNYTSTWGGENYGKGTVSYNSSTITLKTTHAWNGSSWVILSRKKYL